MNHVSIDARLPKRHQSSSESAFGLLIAVINSNPDDLAAQRRQFRQLLFSSGYEDFLDDLIREWWSIKYTSAVKAATPMSPEMLAERVKSRKEASKKATAAKNRAKELIGERLFSFIMPNGKPLSQCTGSECEKVGGQFAKIGQAVGKRKIVGKVMTASDITKLLSERG